MFVYWKKKIRSSAFPPLPHTFTVAHSQSTWVPPLCLHRADIGAKVEGRMCWHIVTVHRASWEWVRALVKYKISGPSSKDSLTENLYIEFRSKLPDTPFPQV